MLLKYTNTILHLLYKTIYNILSSLPRAPEYADCFLCTYLHTLHFLYKHYKQYAVIHGGDNRYSAMINTARTIHKIPNVTEHTIRNQQTMNDVLNNIFDSDKYAVMNFGSTSTKQRNNNNNALQSPLQSSINHGSKSAPTTPHCAIKSPIPHTNNTTNDNTKKSHFDFSSVESVLTNKLVLDTVTEQNGIDNETHLSNNGSTSTKLHNSNIMRCDKSWCFVSAYAYGVDGKCSFSQQSCKHMIVKQGTPNAAINHIYQYHKDYCARKQIHDVNNDIYIYCEDCQNKIYTVQYYNDTQHYKVHKRFKLAYKKL